MNDHFTDEELALLEDFSTRRQALDEGIKALLEDSIEASQLQVIEEFVAKHGAEVSEVFYFKADDEDCAGREGCIRELAWVTNFKDGQLAAVEKFFNAGGLPQ